MNGDDNELKPWLVVLSSATKPSLAMWRLAESQQPALALFSSEAHARRYATSSASEGWSVEQPARTVLVEIMIECFQQHVELAVLDPDQGTARQIFKLRDVLRAARAELMSTDL